MSTRSVFESYFNMLEETLEEYNLKDNRSITVTSQRCH